MYTIIIRAYIHVKIYDRREIPSSRPTYLRQVDRQMLSSKFVFLAFYENLLD